MKKILLKLYENKNKILTLMVLFIFFGKFFMVVGFQILSVKFYQKQKDGNCPIFENYNASNIKELHENILINTKKDLIYKLKERDSNIDNILIYYFEYRWWLLEKELYINRIITRFFTGCD